jgi:hypothetical protein
MSAAGGLGISETTHFSGTFVSGMIEMNMIMQTDSALGYSGIVKMFAVISSRTRSPNMTQPMMAMEQSRENYQKLDMI